MVTPRPRFDPPFLSAGDLTLDAAARCLIGPDGECELPVGAYVVLRELMKQPGVAVETGALIAAMWPDPDLEPGHAVKLLRTQVCRTRDLVRKVGVAGTLLRAVNGIGYRLDGEARVVRAFTPAQAEALNTLIRSHPNTALAAQVGATA